MVGTEAGVANAGIVIGVVLGTPVGDKEGVVDGENIGTPDDVAGTVIGWPEGERAGVVEKGTVIG